MLFRSKQKTAYEMPVRDWSSDVCSSDLVGCPYIGRAFDDNWGLPDPTGQGDEIFKYVIMQIEKRLNELKNYFCTSNDGLQSESD